MSLGNNIVLTPEPRGRRLEVVCSGALKPGTCVQFKAGVAEDAGGRLTVEPYDVTSSGYPQLVMVLDANWMEGKTRTDAYVDGKRAFVYFPLPGDELNMLIADLAGTGATSDFAIRDPLMIQDGTGELIDAIAGTATYSAKPFMVMETYNDMVGDTFLHVMHTGY